MNTTCFTVDETLSEQRLDVAIVSAVSSISRSRVQQSIRDGCVQVNGHAAKASCRVQAGDQVTLSLPDPVPFEAEPEDISLDIVYEDAWVIVVNKPAHLVVHPACGNHTGTLVNALLFHCRDLAGIGGVQRPGIVHRLDKDTSGVMVAVKNDRAHNHLARQFKSGSVKKNYVALIHGNIKGDAGEIDRPIVRHPKKRKEMSVACSGGRAAITIWRKIEEFNSGFSLLKISLKTGRTHQIRVHFSHIGHPVAGDTVYGYGLRWWKRHPLFKKGVLPFVDRQMLHSRRLGISHPDKKVYMEFEAPLPEDMERVLRVLQEMDLTAKTDKALDMGGEKDYIDAK